ncbi:A/G-specific adenine glycosylase [Cecembia calidifontis]|uniref:Adenine DNA glycosylase n=1 Tax=Cecembia calidifontis TaxID=1187080 RepID=A0A4Q7P7L9_9BACT|nr:A/G-specific adenine glycosylase [Cecembia calidifontis]RZS95518.1 A/G-specific DNA-adenine glycosylase [Cecembia calidifontis]
MSPEVFSNIILEWYSLHKRDLPWRNTQNPYIIWLSEIILQQTRVAQGMPYFEKYVENYPSIQDLALAPEDEVMRLWQGLGYYSRARNLHACAKDIHYKYGGKFPGNFEELIKLKGVGNYTAAAIASFAFGEAVAVVDGNVFRVLSRVFGIAEDIASGRGKRKFEEFANKIIPRQNPGEYNQAIMEFGALQCVPKNPDCSSCPLKQSCYALNRGMVDLLPVKSKKLKVKERYFQYAHILCGHMTVVRQRGEGDIWQGLFDFPLQEFKQSNEFERENHHFFEALNYIETIDVVKDEHVYKHILTHQRIFANFVKFEVKESARPQLEIWASNRGYQLVDAEKLEALAKPRLILKYLNEEK